MSLLDSIVSNENIRFIINLILTIIAVTIAYLFLKIAVRKIVGKKKTNREFIFKKIKITKEELMSD